MERTTDVVTAAPPGIADEDGFGDYLLGLRGQGGPDYMAGLDRRREEGDGGP